MVSAALAPRAVEAAPSEPSLSDIAEPSMSASGQSVVFTATTADGRRSAFHLDRTDGEMIDLVTVPEVRRVGDTVGATLSDDGCVVLAISQIGFDIFRDDDRNQRWDVYRLVLPHCGGRRNDWQLVSTSSDGTARDDISTDQRLSMSSDGTIVAYTAVDTTTTVDGMNEVAIVDVSQPIGSDRRAIEVPGRPDGPPTQPLHYRGSDQPALSGDGRRIAFRADYNPRSATWNDGPQQGGFATARVVVWDRGATLANTTSDPNRADELAVLSPPVDGDAESSQPALSADGSTLAYVATDERGCVQRCITQVYRWTMKPDEPPTLLSAQPWSNPDDGDGTDTPHTTVDRSPAPIAGNGPSRAPTLNANGTMVAFVTDASNLTIGRPRRGGGPDAGTLMIAGTTVATPTSTSDEPTSAQFVLVPALRPGGDDSGPSDDGADGEDGTDREDRAVTTDAILGAQGHPDLSATGTIAMFDVADLGAAASDAAAVEVAATGRQLGVVTIPSHADLAQLDFGSVEPGQTSAELFTSLRNLGPGSIRPTEIHTDSPLFSVNGGTCTTDILVAPGASCTIRVTYTPGGPGPNDAELAVDDDSGPIARAGVHGRGGDPRLRIDPAGADLGRGLVDAQAIGEAIVTITNIALDATQISTVELAGNQPDDFEIIGDDCSDLVLLPEQSCPVRLTFSPIGAGFRSATVVATAASGDVATAVVGGQADQTPTLEPPAGTVEPGSKIELIGHGFEPGSSVWTAMIGGRGLTGPFVVAADGSVVAHVPVPARVHDPEIQVAMQGEMTAALTAAVSVTTDDTPSPSYLPGFGYG